MSRQTFISKDFFVNASEQVARQTILSLPKAISNIKLVAENPRLHSVTFLYERPDDELPNHVAVSLLPLNESHTQVTLHGSYPNGSAFYNDPYINNAVANFESAIHAAINGNLSQFQPEIPKKNISQRFLHLIAMAAAFIGVIFLWRKLS